MGIFVIYLPFPYNIHALSSALCASSLQVIYYLRLAVCRLTYDGLNGGSITYCQHTRFVDKRIVGSFTTTHYNGIFTNGTVCGCLAGDYRCHFDDIFCFMIAETLISQFKDGVLFTNLACIALCCYGEWSWFDGQYALLAFHTRGRYGS